MAKNSYLNQVKALIADIEQIKNPVCELHLCVTEQDGSAQDYEAAQEAHQALHSLAVAARDLIDLLIHEQDFIDVLIYARLARLARLARRKRQLPVLGEFKPRPFLDAGRADAQATQTPRE
jgi:hypothetical protein